MFFLLARGVFLLPLPLPPGVCGVAPLLDMLLRPVGFEAQTKGVEPLLVHPILAEIQDNLIRVVSVNACAF